MADFDIFMELLKKFSRERKIAVWVDTSVIEPNPTEEDPRAWSWADKAFPGGWEQAKDEMYCFNAGRL